MLDQLAPSLAFTEAKTRYEILLACQVDPARRVAAHLALYEFLAARDERHLIRHQRPALLGEITTLSDDSSRADAMARCDMVDAQIAWRDGHYTHAIIAARRAAELVCPLADAGSPEHAETRCNAIQLVAQLQWEMGAAGNAFASLNLAGRIIKTHQLQTRPCAVTNAVGRADLLMREAPQVAQAIAVASTAFDAAAAYGDAEDAAGSLLIIAMARGGQGNVAASVEHATYALEFADDIAPVGRARLLAHVAEIFILGGRLSHAAQLLDRARESIPAESTANAQRSLRVGLLAHVNGSPVEALEIVDHALAQLEIHSARRFIGPGLTIRSRIRWGMGDRSGAITDLEHAVSRLRGESYAWTYAQALRHFGQATHRQADIREAAALQAEIAR